MKFLSETATFHSGKGLEISNTLMSIFKVCGYLMKQVGGIFFLSRVYFYSTEITTMLREIFAMTSVKIQS